jgi:hypothetical protein
MNQDKTYGKFNFDQIKQLLSALANLEQEVKDVRTAFSDNPDKFSEIFTPGFYWSGIYELPFLTHLAFAVKIIGIEQHFTNAAQSTDPQQALLNRIDDDLPDWTGGPDSQYEPKHLLGAVISLTYSLESLVVHCKYLNELVDDVRKGNDSALFKAVQIDRSITSCPTFADRIARADFEQDETFFNRLSKAIKTRPKRPMEEYRELRFTLQALEEAEGLQGLTMEAAYRLLCVDLNLYPHDGKDAARSLWQFISRWKQARST